MLIEQIDGKHGRRGQAASRPQDMLELFGAKLTPNRQNAACSRGACCSRPFTRRWTTSGPTVGHDAAEVAMTAVRPLPLDVDAHSRPTFRSSRPCCTPTPIGGRAAGLSRQRGHHAAAAAGDPGARRRLRAALRQRASRHPLAERPEHRPVRRGPRARCSAFINAAQPRRNHLHARHDRGHQPGGPQLGRRQRARRATRSCSPRWSTTRTSSPGSNWPSAPARRALAADHRRRAAATRRARRSCSTERTQARRRHGRLERAGHDQPAGRDHRRGARRRRAGAGRRGPERAAHADRRAGAGRRLSGLQRAQDARAHRASACSTAAASCSTRCRRFWAAAA